MCLIITTDFDLYQLPVALELRHNVFVELAELLIQIILVKLYCMV